MDKSEIIKKLQEIKQLTEDCLLGLSVKGRPQRTMRKSQEENKTQKIRRVDFDMNIRGFVKEYSKGMNGPKKYTLLTAFLVKGKKGINISAKNINEKWNGVSGLLGGKIRTGMYGTRAKENGWLNSSKSRVYNLSKNWMKIFS